MDSAISIDIYTERFGDGDGLPLNLYQWFFSSLNTPVRLGPIRPGNRAVMITKIAGEYSLMEMQRDKTLPKIKASKRKVLAAKQRVKDVDVLLKSSTNVVMSYSSYRICLVLDVSRSSFSFTSNSILPYTVLLNSVKAMLSQLCDLIRSSKTVSKFYVSIIGATGVEGENVFSIWRGEISSEGQVENLLFIIETRLKELQGELYMSRTSTTNKPIAVGSGFPDMSTFLQAAFVQLDLLPEHSCPMILFFSCGCVNINHNQARQQLLQKRAGLHVIAENSGGDRSAGLCPDVAGLRFLTESILSGSFTQISNPAIENIKSVVGSLCLSECFLRRTVINASQSIAMRLSGAEHSGGELKAYGVEGGTLEHVLALRLLEGFRIVAISQSQKSDNSEWGLNSSGHNGNNTFTLSSPVSASGSTGSTNSMFSLAAGGKSKNTSTKKVPKKMIENCITVRLVNQYSRLSVITYELTVKFSKVGENNGSFAKNDIKSYYIPSGRQQNHQPHYIYPVENAHQYQHMTQSDTGKSKKIQLEKVSEGFAWTPGQITVRIHGNTDSLLTDSGDGAAASKALKTLAAEAAKIYTRDQMFSLMLGKPLMPGYRPKKKEGSGGGERRKFSSAGVERRRSVDGNYNSFVIRPTARHLSAHLDVVEELCNLDGIHYMNLFTICDDKFLSAVADTVHEVVKLLPNADFHQIKPLKWLLTVSSKDETSFYDIIENSYEYSFGLFVLEVTVRDDLFVKIQLSRLSRLSGNLSKLSRQICDAFFSSLSKRINPNISELSLPILSRKESSSSSAPVQNQQQSFASSNDVSALPCIHTKRDLFSLTCSKSNKLAKYHINSMVRRARYTAPFEFSLNKNVQQLLLCELVQAKRAIGLFSIASGYLDHERLSQNNVKNINDSAMNHQIYPSVCRLYGVCPLNSNGVSSLDSLIQCVIVCSKDSLMIEYIWPKGCNDVSDSSSGDGGNNVEGSRLWDEKADKTSQYMENLVFNLMEQDQEILSLYATAIPLMYSAAGKDVKTNPIDTDKDKDKDKEDIPMEQELVRALMNMRLHAYQKVNENEDEDLPLSSSVSAFKRMIRRGHLDTLSLPRLLLSKKSEYSNELVVNEVLSAMLHVSLVGCNQSFAMELVNRIKLDEGDGEGKERERSDSSASAANSIKADVISSVIPEVTAAIANGSSCRELCLHSFAKDTLFFVYVPDQDIPIEFSLTKIKIDNAACETEQAADYQEGGESEQKDEKASLGLGLGEIEEMKEIQGEDLEINNTSEGRQIANKEQDLSESERDVYNAAEECIRRKSIGLVYGALSFPLLHFASNKDLLKAAEATLATFQVTNATVIDNKNTKDKAKESTSSLNEEPINSIEPALAPWELEWGNLSKVFDIRRPRGDGQSTTDRNSGRKASVWYVHSFLRKLKDNIFAVHMANYARILYGSIQCGIQAPESSAQLALDCCSDRYIEVDLSIMYRKKLRNLIELTARSGSTAKEWLSRDTDQARSTLLSLRDAFENTLGRQLTGCGDTMRNLFIFTALDKDKLSLTVPNSVEKEEDEEKIVRDDTSKFTDLKLDISELTSAVNKTRAAKGSADQSGNCVYVRFVLSYRGFDENPAATVSTVLACSAAGFSKQIVELMRNLGDVIDRYEIWIRMHLMTVKDDSEDVFSVPFQTELFGAVKGINDSLIMNRALGPREDKYIKARKSILTNLSAGINILRGNKLSPGSGQHNKYLYYENKKASKDSTLRKAVAVSGGRSKAGDTLAETLHAFVTMDTLNSMARMSPTSITTETLVQVQQCFRDIPQVENITFTLDAFCPFDTSKIYSSYFMKNKNKNFALSLQDDSGNASQAEKDKYKDKHHEIVLVLMEDELKNTADIVKLHDMLYATSWMVPDTKDKHEKDRESNQILSGMATSTQNISGIAIKPAPESTELKDKEITSEQDKSSGRIAPAVLHSAASIQSGKSDTESATTDSTAKIDEGSQPEVMIRVPCWVLINVYTQSNKPYRTTKDTSRSARHEGVDSLSVSTMKVSVQFCKTEGSDDMLEFEHAKIAKSFKKVIEKCSYRVNQRLLLEDLHESKVASPFLLERRQNNESGLVGPLNPADKDKDKDKDKANVEKEKNKADTDKSASAKGTTPGEKKPPSSFNRGPVNIAPRLSVKSRREKEMESIKAKAAAETEAAKASADASGASIPIVITPKKVINPLLHDAFKNGKFSCPRQGVITCTVHTDAAISHDAAVRHLETFALSQFVVTNNVQYFVTRDNAGNVYYMSFDKPTEKSEQGKVVRLIVYGLAPMDRRMVRALQQLLDDRLAEITAKTVSSVLSRSPALQYSYIPFLKQSAGSRHLSVRFVLPPSINDIYFFCCLVRHIFLNSELLSAVSFGQQKPTSVSELLHPASLGYNFQRKSADHSRHVVDLDPSSHEHPHPKGGRASASSPRSEVNSKSKFEFRANSNLLDKDNQEKERRPFHDAVDYKGRPLSMSILDVDRVPSGPNKQAIAAGFDVGTLVVDGGEHMSSSGMPRLERKSAVDFEVSDPYTVNPIFFGRQKKIKKEANNIGDKVFDRQRVAWQQNDFTFLYNLMTPLQTSSSAQLKAATKYIGQGLALVEVFPSIKLPDQKSSTPKTESTESESSVGEDHPHPNSVDDKNKASENVQDSSSHQNIQILTTGSLRALEMDIETLEKSLKLSSSESDDNINSSTSDSLLTITKKDNIHIHSEETLDPDFEESDVDKLESELDLEDSIGTRAIQLRIFPTVAMNIQGLAEYCSACFHEAVTLYHMDRLYDAAGTLMSPEQRIWTFAHHEAGLYGTAAGLTKEQHRSVIEKGVLSSSPDIGSEGISASITPAGPSSDNLHDEKGLNGSSGTISLASIDSADLLEKDLSQTDTTEKDLSQTHTTEQNIISTTVSDEATIIGDTEDNTLGTTQSHVNAPGEISGLVKDSDSANAIESSHIKLHEDGAIVKSNRNSDIINEQGIGRISVERGSDEEFITPAFKDSGGTDRDSADRDDLENSLLEDPGDLNQESVSDKRCTDESDGSRDREPIEVVIDASSGFDSDSTGIEYMKRDGHLSLSKIVEEQKDPRLLDAHMNRSLLRHAEGHLNRLAMLIRSRRIVSEGAQTLASVDSFTLPEDGSVISAPSFNGPPLQRSTSTGTVESESDRYSTTAPSDDVVQSVVTETASSSSSLAGNLILNSTQAIVEEIESGIYSDLPLYLDQNSCCLTSLTLSDFLMLTHHVLMHTSSDAQQDEKLIALIDRANTSTAVPILSDKDNAASVPDRVSGGAEPKLERERSNPSERDRLSAPLSFNLTWMPPISGVRKISSSLSKSGAQSVLHEAVQTLLVKHPHLRDGMILSGLPRLFDDADPILTKDYTKIRKTPDTRIRSGSIDETLVLSPATMMQKKGVVKTQTNRLEAQKGKMSAHLLAAQWSTFSTADAPIQKSWSDSAQYPDEEFGSGSSNGNGGSKEELESSITSCLFCLDTPLLRGSQNFLPEDGDIDEDEGEEKERDTQTQTHGSVGAALTSTNRMDSVVLPENAGKIELMGLDPRVLYESGTQSSHVRAPLPSWLCGRKSTLEVSISTTGVFIFYFNISPVFVNSLYDICATLTRSAQLQRLAHENEYLISMGLGHCVPRQIRDDLEAIALADKLSNYEREYKDKLEKGDKDVVGNLVPPVLAPSLSSAMNAPNTLMSSMSVASVDNVASPVRNRGPTNQESNAPVIVPMQHLPPRISPIPRHPSLAVVDLLKRCLRQLSWESKSLDRLNVSHRPQLTGNGNKSQNQGYQYQGYQYQGKGSVLSCVQESAWKRGITLDILHLPFPFISTPQTMDGCDSDEEDVQGDGEFSAEHICACRGKCPFSAYVKRLEAASDKYGYELVIPPVPPQTQTQTNAGVEVKLSRSVYCVFVVPKAAVVIASQIQCGADGISCSITHRAVDTSDVLLSILENHRRKEDDNGNGNTDNTHTQLQAERPSAIRGNASINTVYSDADREFVSRLLGNSKNISCAQYRVWDVDDIDNLDSNTMPQLMPTDTQAGKEGRQGGSVDELSGSMNHNMGMGGSSVAPPTSLPWSLFEHPMCVHYRQCFVREALGLLFSSVIDSCNAVDLDEVQGLSNNSIESLCRFQQTLDYKRARLNMTGKIKGNPGHRVLEVLNRLRPLLGSSLQTHEGELSLRAAGGDNNKPDRFLAHKASSSSRSRKEKFLRQQDALVNVKDKRPSDPSVPDLSSKVDQAHNTHNTLAGEATESKDKPVKPVAKFSELLRKVRHGYSSNISVVGFSDTRHNDFYPSSNNKRERAKEMRVVPEAEEKEEEEDEAVCKGDDTEAKTLEAETEQGQQESGTVDKCDKREKENQEEEEEEKEEEEEEDSCAGVLCLRFGCDSMNRGAPFSSVGLGGITSNQMRSQALSKIRGLQFVYLDQNSDSDSDSDSSSDGSEISCERDKDKNKPKLEVVRCLTVAFDADSMGIKIIPITRIGANDEGSGEHTWPNAYGRDTVVSTCKNHSASDNLGGNESLHGTAHQQDKYKGKDRDRDKDKKRSGKSSKGKNKNKEKDKRDSGSSSSRGVRGLGDNTGGSVDANDAYRSDLICPVYPASLTIYPPFTALQVRKPLRIFNL